MTQPDAEAELVALYEGLARWRWRVRRWRRTPPGVGLEVHKRLLPPPPGSAGPGAGTRPLHAWLLALAGTLPDGALLDLGCGFGGTLDDLVLATGRVGVGLTNSPFQAARATEEAARLGLATRCAFRVQSYDAPIMGSHALAIAIEAVFHACDLARTFANVAKSLVPGGRLVLCEDVLVEGAARELPAARELARQWATPRLHAREDYERALAASGFVITTVRDLSAQVPTSPEVRLARRERRLGWLSRLPLGRSTRALLAAYRGGIALERLYAGGHARYLAIAATLAGPARSPAP